MFTFQPSDNIAHTHTHAVVFLSPQSYDLRMKRIILSIVVVFAVLWVALFVLDGMVLVWETKTPEAECLKKHEEQVADWKKTPEGKKYFGQDLTEEEIASLAPRTELNYLRSKQGPLCDDEWNWQCTFLMVDAL